MGEPKNLGLAAAVAGGYLLGRGKKGQMALTAAAMLAGRGLRPGGLVAEGIRKVPGVPAAVKNKAQGDETGTATEKGKDGGRDHHGALSRAARSTASSVANRGLSALTDALHERTLALGDEPHDGEGEDSNAQDGGEEAEGDADEADATEEQPESEPEPERAPPASKRATEKAAPKKRPAKKPAPKKRTAPKKPAASKTPAGKRPSSARKTTAKKNQPTEKAAPRTRRER